MAIDGTDGGASAGGHTPTIEKVVARAEALCADVELEALAAWKARGGHAVGLAPAYAPAEMVDAAGALPVHLAGGGPTLEVVQGDAFFQSAICHLPRSLVELGVRGRLRPLDLVVVPSTCDVMRNLTGIWRLLFPAQRVHYLDLPQRSDDAGRRFYRRSLEDLREDLAAAVGAAPTPESLRRSIASFNARRRVLRDLEALRAREPWRVKTSELWLLVRAGSLLPVAEHVDLLRQYLDACRAARRAPLDVARVVVVGAFCEQPPVGFLRALERAGCAIVADDFLLGLRWLAADVDEQGDPLDALVDAYLANSPPAPCRFEGAGDRAGAIVRLARDRRAAGVILASPSFCDPALLDRPAIADALEAAGLPQIQLQYAENGVDYGSVREQAGAFADALRLWDAA